MEISVTNLISKVTEIDEVTHELFITFSKILLQKSITAIQEPSV